MLLVFHRRKRKKKKKAKKPKHEKSCFSISVWMHYIKHFFQTYCFALPCLHLSSSECWTSVLPAAFSSVTWFTAELLSFVSIVTPPYVFSIPGAPQSHRLPPHLTSLRREFTLHQSIASEARLKQSLEITRAVKWLIWT